MKFLVLQKRAAGVSLPEDSYDLWTKARDWLSGLKKANKIESMAWMSGAGAMAVMNVDSHEELAKILQVNPLKPWGAYEIYPLSDIEEFVNGMLGA